MFDSGELFSKDPDFPREPWVYALFVLIAIVLLYLDHKRKDF